MDFMNGLFKLSVSQTSRYLNENFFPSDSFRCNFTPDIPVDRFLELIFVSFGDSRNWDCTVRGVIYIMFFAFLSLHFRF